MEQHCTAQHSTALLCCAQLEERRGEMSFQTALALQFLSHKEKEREREEGAVQYKNGASHRVKPFLILTFVDATDRRSLCR